MAVPVEAFVLDPAHSGTLQRQLQEIVTAGILSGRFRPRDRMPSSRALARHLGLSRITVTLAYTDLVANDYLTARGRSGYFVSDGAPTPPLLAPGDVSTDTVDWGRAFARRYSYGPALGRPKDWRTYRYPFIYGQTDRRLFDHQNWRRCALQALGARDFEATTADRYGEDDALLTEQIVRHILPRRGIAARPEQVLITMGAQNALWMTKRLLLARGRTATIEHPCYPALRAILESSPCETVGIPVDDRGLPPERVPSRTDVLYVTPSHHCPTSATLPVERRRALLAQADRDDFLIVEDDYEFELAFAAPPAPALKSLDRSGRVIYVGSFSKSLFPGLRLGYLVAPEPFVAEARALRSVVVRHVPGHLQRAAAYFLEQGHYDAQVHRMARIFRERRDVTAREIARHGLLREGADTFGGSSFWMRTGGMAAEALAERLRGWAVLIEPGAPFYGAADPGDRYRLAYSSIPAEDIPEGLRRVAESLDWP